MNDTLFPCTALWRSIAEAGPGSGIGAFGDGVDEGRAAMVERLPVGIAVGPLYRPFEGGVEALRLHFDGVGVIGRVAALHGVSSEEHTSELQSLMHISYAVFCLNKKKSNQIDQPKKQNIN